MLATEQPKMTISERRATYPLQERLKIYNPDTMAKKLNKQEKPSKLVVHGVNILNKKSVDSDTAMDRIQQRRKTHNRVEKRRRSNMVNSSRTNVLIKPLTLFYLEYSFKSIGRSSASKCPWTKRWRKMSSSQDIKVRYRIHLYNSPRKSRTAWKAKHVIIQHHARLTQFLWRRTMTSHTHTHAHKM